MAPDETHRRGPLPSTFSVRALGAIHALVSGESATPSLRARAVGAAQRWAPDEAVFSAGFARFTGQHALGALGSTSEVRRSLVVAAKTLILASKVDIASKEDEMTSDAVEPRIWDPDRVVPHRTRRRTRLPAAPASALVVPSLRQRRRLPRAAEPATPPLDVTRRTCRPGPRPLHDESVPEPGPIARCASASPPSIEVTTIASAR
jgi:hypothetical protein